MHIKYLFLAAAAYYLAGRLGLMLAIPPGFASAIWPAAGIALACVLLTPRWQACVGIWLGSFLLNATVVDGGISQVSMANLLVPAYIGVGAVAQAYTGCWLYRKLIGLSHCLDAPRQICWFLLVVCPVSCLLAASVGTAALLVNGLINPTNGLFTWLTWWTGDTIGTMLFTPLLLTLFALDIRLAGFRRWQIALPTGVIFFCIVTLFTWSSQNQREHVDFYVQQESTELFNAVEDRLNSATNILRAYDALLSRSGPKSFEEFNIISSILVNENNAFKAVGWIPLLRGNDRPAFEAAMSQELGDNYELKEIGPSGMLINATEQSRYFPVQYLFPLAENEPALGLNLGANPSRLKALENANALRRPVATEPIQLVQSTDDTPSMIIYYPVYQRVSSNDTPMLNANFTRAKLLGYVSGVFTFEELLGDIAARAMQKKLRITASDITESRQVVSLLDTQGNTLKEFRPQHYSLSFGERLFEFSFAATDAYTLASKDWTSWNILTFGFLLAALMQAFILLITGNTERIRAEVERKTGQLTNAKEQAEQANIAKTNFLANMSHELRTPLNAVTGLLTLCLKTKLNNEQHYYLDKAKMAASTLMALINQTLDYSKIESGILELESTSFSLRHILERIHAIFDAQVKEKGLQLIFNMPDRVPERLIGDPLRIEQILLNLCSNAVKFTDKGHVCVTLHPVVTLAKGKKAEFCFDIEDTGIGIEASNRDKIFSAFHQADTSTTRKYGGTGLGLSICKKLANAMDGDITINSIHQQGTKVTAVLRLGVVNPNATVNLDYLSGTQVKPNKKIPSATSKVLNTNVLKGRKVLVVEDIPINQEIARLLLEDYGAHVSTADNGRHALEILIEQPDFDLIFMDIQMPEMDGLEATRRIREHDRLRDLVIIAMTANAVQSDVQACKAAGMNDHVAKPIEEEDLLSKVAKHLRD